MVTEDYVSFETAKLLKEKGFKHWCYKSYGDAVYYKGVPISFDEECDLKSEGLENEIEYVEGGYLYDFGCDNNKKDAKVWAAPTLQMAMKWLREVHHLQICISSYSDRWGEYVHGWQFLIKKLTFSEGLGWNWDDSLDAITDKKMSDDITYATYEETCESGINYCLENLI